MFSAFIFDSSSPVLFFFLLPMQIKPAFLFLRRPLHTFGIPCCPPRISFHFHQWAESKPVPMRKPYRVYLAVFRFRPKRELAYRHSVRTAPLKHAYPTQNCASKNTVRLNATPSITVPLFPVCCAKKGEPRRHVTDGLYRARTTGRDRVFISAFSLQACGADVSIPFFPLFSVL